MKSGYSWTELVEISLSIEEAGEKFYTTAAHESGSDQVKEVLSLLADDERRHGKVFQDLLPDKEETKGIGMEESMPYIQALVDTGIGRYLDQDALEGDAGRGLESTLDFALGFEKETILFYQSLSDLAAENAGSILDQIISEEKGHVRRIHGLQEELLD